jgi:hypothetical protein
MAEEVGIESRMERTEVYIPFEIRVWTRTGFSAEDGNSEQTAWWEVEEAAVGLNRKVGVREEGVEVEGGMMRTRGSRWVAEAVSKETTR